MAAMQFRQPAGASEPSEPYDPPTVALTDSPEADLWVAIEAVRRITDALACQIERSVRREGGDYRASEMILDRAERAATALNTSTAIYRARRGA